MTDIQWFQNFIFLPNMWSVLFWCVFHFFFPVVASFHSVSSKMRFFCKDDSILNLNTVAYRSDSLRLPTYCMETSVTLDALTHRIKAILLHKLLIASFTRRENGARIQIQVSQVPSELPPCLCPWLSAVSLAQEFNTCYTLREAN